MTDNRIDNLDELAAKTYSAVYSDICDHLGLMEQTAGPGLRRLTGSGVVIGWARTAISLPVDQPPARHYGAEIDFLDSLRPGDIAVIDCSRRPAAAWGELFSTASKGRGARGAIIDGYVRDISKIEELGFPVFGRGSRPTDSLGRVSIGAVDVDVTIAGLTVAPNDLVIADADGITVVPRRVADEVIARALEKATTENSARDMLLAGGTMADVWEKYRVL